MLVIRTILLILLVIRSVLLTILLIGFGLNILGNPDINHLLTVTVLTCLLVCTGIRGSVYKNVVMRSKYATE